MDVIVGTKAGSVGGGLWAQVFPTGLYHAKLRKVFWGVGLACVCFAGCCLWPFPVETSFRHLTQAGLKVLIFLPQPPHC